MLVIFNKCLMNFFMIKWAVFYIVDIIFSKIVVKRFFKKDLRLMNPIASRFSVTPFIPADSYGKVEFSVLE